MMLPRHLQAAVNAVIARPAFIGAFGTPLIQDWEACWLRAMPERIVELVEKVSPSTAPHIIDRYVRSLYGRMEQRRGEYRDWENQLRDVFVSDGNVTFDYRSLHSFIKNGDTSVLTRSERELLKDFMTAARAYTSLLKRVGDDEFEVDPRKGALEFPTSDIAAVMCKTIKQVEESAAITLRRNIDSTSTEMLTILARHDVGNPEELADEEDYHPRSDYYRYQARHDQSVYQLHRLEHSHVRPANIEDWT